MKSEQIESIRIKYENQKAEKIAIKIAHKSKLVEIFTDGSRPEYNKPGACKISVRMPNGSRFVRLFDPSHLVSELYDFVESKDLSPLELEAEIGLFSTFPRMLVDREMTFVNAGLIPSSSLNVEELL